MRLLLPIVLLFLCRDELGKPEIVPLTLLRHNSCCSEYQGHKSAVLDFYYSRCILSLLSDFVQFMYLFGAKLFVLVRIRVTYQYIKKRRPFVSPRIHDSAHREGHLVLYLLPY